MKTIESRVAATILQRSEQVEINGVTYDVAPPTCEVLILFSEEISKLQVIGQIDKGRPVSELIRVGKYGRIVGNATAILILGPENLVETRIVKKRVLGISYNKRVVVDRVKELSAILLKKHSPKDLVELIARILVDKLETKNFIALITFLTEQNLLKPTKKVVSKKMTASGL